MSIEKYKSNGLEFISYIIYNTEYVWHNARDKSSDHISYNWHEDFDKNP
jgi:hypothetical protein